MSVISEKRSFWMAGKVGVGVGEVEEDWGGRGGGGSAFEAERRRRLGGAFGCRGTRALR